MHRGQCFTRFFETYTFFLISVSVQVN